MQGTTSNSLPSFSHDQHHETDVAKQKEEGSNFGSRLSRSMKVTGTDTDRSATCDFPFVVHSNYGTISYRFSDNKR